MINGKWLKVNICDTKIELTNALNGRRETNGTFEHYVRPIFELES
jgi:hypothetical protein